MSSTHKEHAVSDPRVFWAEFVLPRLVQTEGISPHDKSGAVLIARQVLNDELSAMHLAMCAMRTRLNALCPISTLPAELLVRIFELCASMKPAGSHVESDGHGHASFIPKHRRLGWIEVTHVCRHWRDTALQSPSLWSDVCFKLGPELMKLILTRAKSFPISIDWDVGRGTKSTQENLNLVSEHLRHTRELSLTGSAAVLEPFIGTLDFPSGILETITLRVHRIPTDLARRNLELPRTMAGCRLPSLRRLFLHGSWVPWSARILHGLVQLEIRLSDAVEGGWHSFSHEDLLGALKNMPTLETLVLQGCLPFGPRMDSRSELVHLPRLKLLRLQGLSAAGFGITRQLQIPASCQLDLKCYDDAYIAEILPFLKTHVRGGATLPPWNMLSIKRVPLVLCFQVWRLSDAPEEDENKFNPGLKNPLSQPDLAISIEDVQRSLLPLKSLCQILPETIRTVDVYMNTLISSGDWIDTLGRYTETDAASISGNSVATFCKALSRTRDGRPVADLQDCPQDQLFLGRLKTLCLSNTDFRTAQHQLRNEHVFHPRLVQWLSERRHVDTAPMLQINIVLCTIKEQWVEELRNVAAVKWDGFEGNCSPRDDDEDGSDENAGW